MTSGYQIPTPGQCGVMALGYTDYATNPHDWDDIDQPPVGCAVTPVNILSFRQAAFDNCIMQRINTNIAAYEQQILTYEEQLLESAAAGTEPPTPQTAAGAAHPNQAPRNEFKPPCATAFWQTDTYQNCPVHMTIQECCKIASKPVRLANFVKLRTCEGLRDARIQYASVPNIGHVANVTDEMYGGGVVTDNNDPDGPPGTLLNYGIGYDNYMAAVAANINLHAQSCRGTEPEEYKLTHYLRPYNTTSQPYEANPQQTDVYCIPECPSGQACPPPATTPAPSSTPNASNKPCPSGYYFVGYNFPHPAWYDTGTEANDAALYFAMDNNPNDLMYGKEVIQTQAFYGGDATNTLGENDVIVGVGQPERDTQDASLAFSQEESLSTPLGIPEFLPPLNEIGQTRTAHIGRIGGMQELETYQRESLRRLGANCLARYERVFKPPGAEDSVLYSAGGIFNARSGGRFEWPHSFIGYATNSNPNDAGIFPNENGPPPGYAVRTGLNNARPGDIIVYKLSDLLPLQIAYVNYVNMATPEEQRVNVQYWDQGKDWTAAYSTDRLGIGSSGGSRTFWKHWVPPGTGIQETFCGMTLRAATDPVPLSTSTPVSTPLANVCASMANNDSFDYNTCMPRGPGTANPGGLNCQPSCLDTDEPDCVLPANAWNTALIYRPDEDNNWQFRCTLPITYNGMPTQYNWPATYASNGPAATVAGGIAVATANLLAGALPPALMQNVDTNGAAACIYMGYNPPPSYILPPYPRSQAKLTYCGYSWNGCSEVAGSPNYYPQWPVSTPAPTSTTVQAPTPPTPTTAPTSTTPPVPTSTP